MKSWRVLLCLILCTMSFVMTQSQAEQYVLPYPADCSKFQQCDSSGCFVMKCGRGTEFNPAIGTCDYPLSDRSGCSNRGS